MPISTIVAPVSFLVDAPSGAEKILTSLNTLDTFCKTLRSLQQQKLVFGATVEAYLRRMVGQCALSVKLTHVRPLFRSSQDLRALFSPSIRKRVSLVDRRKTTWDAVRSYIHPISHDLSDASKNIHKNKHQKDQIDLLAWHLYLLCLAAKHAGEVPLAAAQALDNARRIDAECSPHLSAESQARLGVITGVIEGLSQPVEAPSLRLRPNIAANAVRERIEEILEDSYLLEASRLRRFLGLRQNIAAVQRDLRLVLRAIRDHSKWARGLVEVGASLLAGAPAGTEVPAKLADVLSQSRPPDRPVLCTDEWYFPKGKHFLITVREGIGESSFYLGTEAEEKGEGDRSIRAIHTFCFT